MATGTVKWFDATKGFGSSFPMKAARMCSCTFQLLSVLVFKP